MIQVAAHLAQVGFKNSKQAGAVDHK
jgi:hypothetical protein